MPARILSIPFIIAGLSFLYLTWEVDEGYALYIVPSVVISALIYVFSPQINWWWWQRYPPELDSAVRNIFEAQFPFYQKLEETEKKRFRNRTRMYMEAHDFMPQAMENFPEDIKAMIAACAVQITFGLDKFIFSKFERIILYPQPFPTPQFPDTFHASEIYEEDGVILFAAEQLAKGFLQPGQFYSIGLHEYAKVFMIQYPDHAYPKFAEDIWPTLERISGISQEFIQKWINLDYIDPVAVSIAHFFCFPNKFKAELPEVYSSYAEIFNQQLV